MILIIRYVISTTVEKYYYHYYRPLIQHLRRDPNPGQSFGVLGFVPVSFLPKQKILFLFLSHVSILHCYRATVTTFTGTQSYDFFFAFLKLLIGLKE